MATKSTIFTRNFGREIRTIRLEVTGKKLEEGAKKVAQSILADAINAPIPRRTGALAASGTVRSTTRGRIVFGFRTFYAEWMDVGTKNLPAKPFGSERGPNFYFTGTLDKRIPGVLEDLKKIVTANLREFAKRSKQRTGRRRR